MQPNDENTPKDLNETPLSDNNQGAPQLPSEETASPEATAPSTTSPEVITPTQPKSDEPQDTSADESVSAEPNAITPESAPEVSPSEKPGDPTPTAVPTETESSSPATSSATPAAVAAGAFAADQVSSGGGKGKKKRLKLLIVAVVAIILLAAASTGAYFGLVLPNQPQRVAQDAITNTINSEKLKSSKFEGEVSFSGGDISKAVSSVSFEGAANDSSAVDLKLSVNTAVTKIGFDLKSTDGKTIYLKLSGLTGLDKLLAASVGQGESVEAALITQLAPLLNQVNDKWFFIDESLLSQVVDENPLTSGDKVTSEDAKKIGEIYQKNQFLNIDKRLADQDIHGVASHHVQATINKDKLKSFLQDLKAANIKGLEIKQEEIDSIKDVDFSKYPFEMWVSKKDRFLTQVATTIQDSGTTAKIRIALFDMNKPVTVEKPADASSVLELLGQVSPLLMGGGLGAGAGSSNLFSEDL